MYKRRIESMVQGRRASWPASRSAALPDGHSGRQRVPEFLHVCPPPRGRPQPRSSKSRTTKNTGCTQFCSCSSALWALRFATTIYGQLGSDFPHCGPRITSRDTLLSSASPTLPHLTPVRIKSDECPTLPRGAAEQPLLSGLAECPQCLHFVVSGCQVSRSPTNEPVCATTPRLRLEVDAHLTGQGPESLSKERCRGASARKRSAAAWPKNAA